MQGEDSGNRQTGEGTFESPIQRCRYALSTYYVPELVLRAGSTRDGRSPQLGMSGETLWKAKDDARLKANTVEG